MQKSDPTAGDGLGDLVEDIVGKLIAEADPLARYRALTRAQSLHEGVVTRIAAERARAVGEMHHAGLSYGRIAEEIGFTRARAQQLVERGAASPAVKRQAPGKDSGGLSERIQQFLAEFARTWPRPSVLIAGLSSGLEPMASRTSKEELGALLFADSRFRSLQLGTWLNAPNMTLIQAAVHSIMPPLYPEDSALLVEGVEVAANIQREAARDRAMATGLVAAIAAALLVAATN